MSCNQDSEDGSRVQIRVARMPGLKALCRHSKTDRVLLLLAGGLNIAVKIPPPEYAKQIVQPDGKKPRR
jgi:hypothetical protein